LAPVSFLERVAAIWPNDVAVQHGPQHFTCAEFQARCQLASTLLRRNMRALGK
jgi:hypothetical protein